MGILFWIIALIVALTKRDLPREINTTGSSLGRSDSILSGDGAYRFYSERKIADVPNGWRCAHCGRVNAGYVGTCACGRDKTGNTQIKALAKGKQDSDGWKCMRCGRINAMYTGTCACGQSKSENVQKNGAEETLFCTACGKQIDAKYKFCRYCGAEVDKL